MNESDVLQGSEIRLGIIDGQHERGVDGAAKPQDFELFDRRDNAPQADFGLQKLGQEDWVRVKLLRNTLVDGGKICGCRRTGRK